MRAFEAHVLVTVVAPSALTVEGELARAFKLSRWHGGSFLESPRVGSAKLRAPERRAIPAVLQVA